MTAFSDVNSFSGLVESLRNADRRDVELVALLAISHEILTAMQEAAESRGDPTRANEDFAQWMLRGSTTDPLDG